MTQLKTTIDADSAAQKELNALMALALALQACAERDVSAAFAALARLLREAPEHAAARHLLGALYAQAGNVEESLEQMHGALEIDPDMVLLRFQYGLLLLTSGNPGEAAAIWSPLAVLGDDHVLNRFSAGMLRMAAGEYDAARRALTLAHAENTIMPALDYDLLAALAALPPEVDMPAYDDSKPQHDGQHVLLSSYHQSDTLN